MINAALIVLGLVLLTIGGDLLVKGAGRLALLARVRPAVVGVTVVAMGTSLPELVVSIQAALRGAPDLAVGNVVGSNIYNILLVLGVAAVIRPLALHTVTVRVEWPVMMAAAIAVLVLGHDASLGTLDGVVLLAGMVAFVGWTVRLALRADTREPASSVPDPAALGAGRRAWGLAAVETVVGAAMLVGGATALVSGASAVATTFGVSERIIGLTVVAIGTSLPELFTSAVASFKGHDDVAVANVVGSNIFNVVGILGATAVVSPIAINQQILHEDAWWMIGASALLLPLMWPGMRLARWKGALLLGGATAYSAVLYMDMGTG